MQSFVSANISYMHYRTFHYVDPVPSPHTNCKFQYLQSYFKPNLQKNVPANNYHPKVCQVAIIVMINKQK